ncbi:MAG: cytochrome d ubiquinol oxidase subunit II [Bacteroidota bacterium]
MLQDISHLALQQYWWIIISLLGSLLVFLLFVQGGQTLIYTLGNTDTERSMLVNVLGRKWETTFTTLVTFGGAFFASFPLFYATSFGGAYWVWMLILFCFIIQAISYEFRSKPNNFFGKKTYDLFLFINGAFGTTLLGIAVGTFFTGGVFSVNQQNITNPLNPVISRWESPWHGLEALLNLQNIALGLTVFFLARIIGIQYFLKNVDDESLFKKCRRHLLYNTIPFLIVFLYFSISLFLSRGYAYDPSSGEVFMEKYKYFHNLIEMPAVGIIFLLGVIGVLYGIARPIIHEYEKGIFFTGLGTVMVVLSLFLIAGFNNTAFYPSSFDLQSSLTIENSSSSLYTLKAMSIVSLIMPFVFAYILHAWRLINKKKINAEEVTDVNEHNY